MPMIAGCLEVRSIGVSHSPGPLQTKAVAPRADECKGAAARHPPLEVSN